MKILYNIIISNMVMTRGKGGASKTKTYNKAKANRKSFKSTQKKYKADYQSIQCATYLEGANSTLALASNSGHGGAGALVNALIPSNSTGVVVANIALTPRNTNLACPTHSAYKGLFNEYRCSAIYIDLLLNKPLRESCENVFLLVERGNNTLITSVADMVTDVNHKMYKCNNNIQTIKFKHIFSDIRDKIFKKTADEADIDPNETVYLKILAPVSNYSDTASINANDCQISMRVKMFNQYKDMRVLTGTGVLN